VANGHRPDVLVLDWHMPALSGLDVCRFLRQTHDEATLPILILTATGGQDDLVEGLSVGANDFVGKSFDPAELLARVGTLARSRKLHDRLRHTELTTRRAREAADEANRAKDAFLATVSHELRTPLNSILGWSRLLKEGKLDDATRMRGLETIERNARIQVQLIEDLLDTTRVISGKLQLESSRTDFATVVRNAVDSIRPAAEHRAIELSLAVEPGRYVFSADSDRLHQAVSNLLTNAVKFTSAGGSIHVSLRHDGSSVELSVRDTGKGISGAFLPHVFDRFRQEDETTTRRQAGLGIGLALVKHIVTAHGGQIGADSRGEGLGATFTIRLPYSEAPRSRDVETDRPSPAPSAPSTTLPLGKLMNARILIVEDDDDARDLLATVLTRQGAVVDAAASSAEALLCIERQVPDLIMSDIGLPSDDGYQLLQAIRARGIPADRLPAIALTAYSRREDQRLAEQAGFQAHVAKPVEPARLIAVAAELVSRLKRVS
ncbi:MAG TPA: response regulator, partial [Polyangiaceae bacterium]|nr:response regulator [Polyangiaceae bacterium]